MYPAFLRDTLSLFYILFLLKLHEKNNSYNRITTYYSIMYDAQLIIKNNIPVKENINA